MKRLRTFLLAVLVFGVGYGATSVVAQVGAALYKNPATGRSYPQQISAGYLATADGGVVNVTNSPAPTAVGQALRSITTGTAATAGFVADPAATTTAAGVVQLGAAGGAQPTLPAGTNAQVLAVSTTGTGTSTNWQPATLPVYTSMSLATQARIAAASGTATGTATQAMPADAKVARATSRNISTTTSTATASSTATDLVGSDAQVILPVASTAAAGIVQLGASARIVARAGTDTGSSTATQGMPIDAIATIGENLPRLGQVLFGAGTNTGTSTSTGTRLIFGYIQEAHVYGLVDSIVSKQASLGTSTQGAILYNGSTSTSTSTTSSPVWGAPPAGAAIDTATPTNVTAGAGSAGSNGKASDSGHIHHIGANTPTHGQWLVAGTDTTTSTNTTNAVMWATLPVPANSVRTIYSAQLSGLVTVSSNTWTSVLSVSTSGSAGRIIAYGAITLTSYSASRCDARIVLDNYAGGDGPALKGVTDSNVQASLSPIYTTTFAAGAHTVNLQVLNFSSINCYATVGYQSESFGSLIVQEFTN